jgi:hypothetical protein
MERVDRKGEPRVERLLRLTGRARAHLNRVRGGLSSADQARATSLAGSPLTDSEKESLFFQLERFAWAMISMAELLVFELRLTPGSFQKPGQLIDVLVREAGLPLGDGRRIKQLLEYRLLSQREPEVLLVDSILDADSLREASEVFEIFAVFAEETLA